MYVVTFLYLKCLKSGLRFGKRNIAFTLHLFKRDVCFTVIQLYASVCLIWSLICIPTHRPPGKMYRQHMEDIAGTYLCLFCLVLALLRPFLSLIERPVLTFISSHINNSNSLCSASFIKSSLTFKTFGIQQPCLQQKVTKQHVTPILACLNRPPVAFRVRFKIFINNI